MHGRLYQVGEARSGSDYEHPANTDKTLLSFILSGSYKVLLVLLITSKTRDQNSKDRRVGDP